MIHPDTFVQPTDRGMGLFASRDFARGEILWILDDHDIKIDLDAFEAIDEKQRIKFNIYGYLDFQKRVIVPWDEGKYVNHSCDPNSTGLLQYDNVSLALRNIKAGEEIVEDYGSYFGHFESFECRCGSPNCRGLISEHHKFKADLRINLKDISVLLRSLDQYLLRIETFENREFLKVLNSVEVST
ncbi:SET domain-containing protein [Leptospira sp. 'Mane']|uniref:SET domain-containing protein n=1 Tax=Leptospira sp. 'Mane' TaxID=3387407 RepID=UPI00398ACA55